MKRTRRVLHECRSRRFSWTGTVRTLVICFFTLTFAAELSQVQSEQLANMPPPPEKAKSGCYKSCAANYRKCKIEVKKCRSSECKAELSAKCRDQRHECMAKCLSDAGSSQKLVRSRLQLQMFDCARNL